MGAEARMIASLKRPVVSCGTGVLGPQKKGDVALLEACILEACGIGWTVSLQAGLGDGWHWLDYCRGVPTRSTLGEVGGFPGLVWSMLDYYGLLWAIVNCFGWFRTSTSEAPTVLTQCGVVSWTSSPWSWTRGSGSWLEPAL